MVALAMAAVACSVRDSGGDDGDSGGGTGDPSQAEDVGEACDHAGAQAGAGPVVTTPDPGCDAGICIYADEDEPPAIDCVPGGTSCNDVSANPAANKFECVARPDGGGRCVIRQDYFLSRSFCSKVCVSDDECRDSAVGDTACEAGFLCARVARSGDLCCEKTCVCADDLGVTTDLDQMCAADPVLTCDSQNPGVVVPSGRAVDILFVVDNSGSMGEEQGMLASAASTLVDALDALGADYRIGFTTTDNGNPMCSGTTPEGGTLTLSSCRSRLDEFVFDGTNPPLNKQDEACNAVCSHDEIMVIPTTTADDPTPKPHPWLEGFGGASNVEGGVPMAEAFACVAPQGIVGCGFESHLESMYKAFKRAEDSLQTSYGFLRKDAAMVTVFVSDEVDCSYRADYDSIFLPEGDRAFWSDPAAAFPTSAVCWNAGVTCTGGPGTYDECHSENKDELGNATGPGTAVLHPATRYIDLLQGYENQKKQINPDQEVLVAAISGVPTGYEDGQDLVYQDTADAQFQLDYGIGPGCSSAVGLALPPVRMREVAEAMQVDGRNLYSVCASDYAPAFGAIADAIAEQIPVGCVPHCVADIDPATETLEHDCAVQEEVPTDVGPVTNEIQACDVDITAGTWDWPGAENVCWRARSDASGLTPSVIDDLDPRCSDRGFNLELVVERRPGFPAVPGTVVRATCSPCE